MNLHVVVFIGTVVFILGISGQRPAIYPVAFRLPPPPTLTGPLSANSELTNGEKVHNNLVQGPSSFVNYEDNLFAGTSDNKIYQMATCPPRLVASLSPPGCKSVWACGQMLSIRVDPTTGLLVVLDTYRGLFYVHPITGQIQQILSTRTPVNGRRPAHLNDMVITPDGVIIMSDSSNNINFENSVYICLDGRPTGRLIAYIPRTGSLTELLPHTFNFPNGLELTPDGDLLVAETCRAKVHRVSLKKFSWLNVTTFAENLPGLPDNIRSSGRGTFWVAMTYARHTGINNPVDRTSTNPDYRAMGSQWMSRADLEALFPKWGIAVELDGSGNILKSLQDPTGTVLTSVTEVLEFDGTINVGSNLVPYMTRLIPSDNKLSLESFIQVLRSRCSLRDSQVESAKQTLLQREKERKQKMQAQKEQQQQLEQQLQKQQQQKEPLP